MHILSIIIINNQISNKRFIVSKRINKSFTLLFLKILLFIKEVAVVETFTSSQSLFASLKFSFRKSIARVLVFFRHKTQVVELAMLSQVHLTDQFVHIQRILM